MEKKTVLYDEHVKLGAKMVPFGGFIMPVQYTNIIGEHMAVREKAGLFDVSHMGEVSLEGPDAEANLNYLLTNDFTGMKAGKVRYSPMCNDSGGVVDDLLVYKMEENSYLIVVNASNKDKDVEWIQSHLFGEVTFRDISDDIAQIAVQGPLSAELLSKFVEKEKLPDQYYTFRDAVFIEGICCLVSQTGYTGEYGFELYFPAADGPKLWNLLVEAGKEYGIIPCGLGARDTLRLEASMPLYGHEMNDEITPLETGLNFAVKMGKKDFIGKRAMEEKGEPKIARIGIKVTGRGIIREHMDVMLNGKQIGHTTSGTILPFVGGSHAMALLEKEYAKPGLAVTVNVRGREVPCETEALPFYTKKK